MNWDQDISMLEEYFNNHRLPEVPVQLNKGEKIVDMDKFITSHLRTIKVNNGNEVFLPHLNRLKKLKKIMEASQ